MKPFVDISELKHSLIDSNIDVEILESLLQYVHDAKVVPLLSPELCEVIKGSIIDPEYRDFVFDINGSDIHTDLDIDMQREGNNLKIQTDRDDILFLIRNKDLILQHEGI